jgi:hypothetical protein
VAQPSTLAKAGIYLADALTDSAGLFRIDHVDTGSYAIEITDGVQASLIRLSINWGDSGFHKTDTLHPYAAITGTIDTSGVSGLPIYLQVVGLQRLVAVDTTGRYTIADLPAGIYDVRVVAVSGNSARVP